MTADTIIAIALIVAGVIVIVLTALSIRRSLCAIDAIEPLPRCPECQRETRFRPAQEESDGGDAEERFLDIWWQCPLCGANSTEWEITEANK